MDADFWGLLILPGKKYSNEAHQPIRLTTACFGEKVIEGSRSCVYLTIGEKEFVLCVLSESLNESQSLDVYLPTEAEFSFRVSGPNEVHLTGHIVSPPEGSEYESGSDDDELMQAFARGELNSDSDDSYTENVSEDSESLEQASIEEIVEKKEQPILKEKEKKRKSPKEINQDLKPIQATPASVVQADLSKEEKTHTVLKESNQEPKPLTTVPSSETQNGISKKQKKRLAKLEAEKANAQKEETPKRKAEEATSGNKKVKAELNKPQQKAPEVKQVPPQSGAKTYPNGLVVEDKVVGNGNAAMKGKKVEMRYIGKLKNGKVFDQNSKGAPFSFRLGAGEVIRGWDLGIEGMKIGGERRLTIPSELAYGKKGAGRDIPGNATLIFDVKLLGVK